MARDERNPATGGTNGRFSTPCKMTGQLTIRPKGKRIVYMVNAFITILLILSTEKRFSCKNRFQLQGTPDLFMDMSQTM